MKCVTQQWTARLVACIVLPALAHAQTLDVSLVDGHGNPVAGIGVVVETTQQPPPPDQPPHAVIDQHDEQFVPRVSIVRRGTEIAFPNTDRVQHHVYSFSPAKQFELPLYRGNQHPPVLFDRDGIVVLGCNIHDHMIGYVLVVDTPYFGFSDSNGRIHFAALPNDNVKVTVWHPGLHVGFGAISRSMTLDSEQSRLAIEVPRVATQPQESSLSWNDY